ncbi:MAG TPA: BON domain-containing protein [Xanthomonadaceae bacterium]|nr:BON domain-containing protein [Xanthomonadaceae bacterium]
MNQNQRSSNIRMLLATSLSLGLLLGTGQALAVDSPKKADVESQKPVTDTWITTKVKADLLATENVSGTDVKVETKNGVVWLSGAVKSKAEHDKAIAVAEGIEGVKSVDASGLKVDATARK